MKSKANIKGHPLHPILVSFPISLLTGALVLDVLARFTGEESYSSAAVIATAGGLISGVMAVIPGAIDYFYSVPPKSSARDRATKHALINLSMLLVFCFALMLRKKGNVSLDVIILLESTGVVLIGIAGWLGGTLIVRNQISIDHRYADAGKWKEQNIHTSDNRIELKEIDSLKLNQMMLLRVNGKRMVVAKTEKGVCVFEDACSHRGGSLADGALICGTVQCPWHGSQFDTTTGEVKAGPAKEKIKIYRVEGEGSKYFLVL